MAGRPGRIIPARAGFTTGGSHGPRGRPDHPRSRGVYDGRITWTAWTPGSSPLARGLRGQISAQPVDVGIIPARAGFTLERMDAAEMARDHPRSRGVYPTGISATGSTAGSSPLARGLPKGPKMNARTTRIIPARAGFTPRPARWTGPDRDHPRSRGVYPVVAGVPGISRGSSPLARGLPDAPAIAPGLTRIIPARAGFTSSRHWPGQWSQDHPRSRGVYRRRRNRRRTPGGSSPLARGLHLYADLPDGDSRIIPARAGFTHDPRERLGARRDHPRSRGVYLS